MSRLLLLLGLLAVVVPPAQAGLFSYGGAFTLEHESGPPIPVANLVGTLQIGPGGTLSFPSQPFSVPGTALLAPLQSCFSPALLVATALAAGALGPPGAVSGSLPIAGAFTLMPTAGAALDLRVPLAMGALLSPTLRQVTSGDPMRADALTLSAEPWTTGAIDLTATLDGVVVSQWSAAGMASTTLQGGRNLQLVTPMHVYHADARLGALPGGKRRTVAIAGRLTLAVPEPASAWLFAAGVLALFGLGRLRLNRPRG